MRKKVIAAMTAALVGLSAAPAGVLAADSYTAAEKALFAEAVETFGTAYDKGLSEYTGQAAGTADITLTLGETGRALAGMFMPIDISWLQDITISDNITVAAANQAQIMDVLVNGTKIGTIEFYMDAETTDIYFRIPEISDAYLKLNQRDIMEESAQLTEDGIRVTTDLADVSKLMENMPTGDVLKDLLNRYGNLVLDNMKDEEAGTEVIEADGISQEATVLTGAAGIEEARTMITGILAEAKTDEQLKDIIDTWTEGNEEFNYDIFVQKIEELEGEIEEGADIDDEGQIVSKLWLDENDEIVGRQLYIDYDNDGQDPAAWVTIWEPSSEDGKKGLYVEFGSDEESFELEGSGTVENGLLSGTYSISEAGQKLLSFNVENYDPAAMEEGIWKGTYSINLGQLDESGSFEGIEFSAALDGDKERSSMLMDLTASGSSLISLAITGEQAAEDHVDLPDLTAFENVYDDLDAYMEGVDPSAVLENLTAAGMPDGFMESVAALLDGDTGEAYYEDEE